MKVKLIKKDDIFYLVLGSGEKYVLGLADVKEFFLNFSENKYYDDVLEVPTLIDFEMEENIIAYINLYGSLCVNDKTILKNIFETKEIKYISVTEYAEKHKKTDVLIRKLCREKRIEGSMLSGKTWIIPEDAPYPKDERFGSKKVLNS